MEVVFDVHPGGSVAPRVVSFRSSSPWASFTRTLGPPVPHATRAKPARRRRHLEKGRVVKDMGASCARKGNTASSNRTRLRLQTQSINTPLEAEGRNARMTAVSSSHGRRDARSVGLEKMWHERTTEDVATQERYVVTSGCPVLSVRAKVAVSLLRVFAPVAVALVRIPTARSRHPSLLIEMPGRIWV